MIYEDINVTKRKTITNGEKYDFFIYDMLSLEKQFQDAKDKKFGKGDTVISCLLYTSPSPRDRG